MTSLITRFRTLENQEAFAEDYLAEVREWLQQKLDYYIEVPNMIHFIQEAKKRVIRELLKELTVASNIEEKQRK